MHSTIDLTDDDEHFAFHSKQLPDEATMTGAADSNSVSRPGSYHRCSQKGLTALHRTSNEIQLPKSLRPSPREFKLPCTVDSGRIHLNNRIIRGGRGDGGRSFVYCSEVGFNLKDVMEQDATLNRNPYEPTSADEINDASGSMHTRNTIIALYCVTTAYGASQVFSYDDGAIYIAYSLLFGLILTHWVVQDMHCAGRYLSSGWRLLYFFTCPISTSIYLIKTRGFIGVGWVLMNFLGIFGSFYLGFFAAYYFLYFSGMWSLMDPIYFDEY